MESLFIEGGARLSGEVEVPASKNASLPLMCLSLLTDESVEFLNLPEVSDIESMRKLLRSLGASVEGGRIHFASLSSNRAEYELVRKMRASILVLGPLLARSGEAYVSMPGGCAIGERPVDIHIEGLKKLGAHVELKEGYIHAKADRLRGAEVPLSFPTVTGTLNILMAACLAEGETRILNAAREPEVVEVSEALIQMGAKISGVGSAELLVQGQSRLKGFSSWEVQADRIQSLTYLAAAAITQGEVGCRPYRPASMDAVIAKFREMGCRVTEGDNRIHLSVGSFLKCIQIETAPFPGFPTDAQAQFMACLSLAKSADGLSRIRETIFENRFQHVSELRRMGANIRLRGNLATIRGVPELSGASVMASDLRASASLVLAGLAAKGVTQVLRIYHLDRGYQGLEKRLESLGAKVWRGSQK